MNHSGNPLPIVAGPDDKPTHRSPRINPPAMGPCYPSKAWMVNYHRLKPFNQLDWFARVLFRIVTGKAPEDLVWYGSRARIENWGPFGYTVTVWVDFRDDCGNQWSYSHLYSNLHGPEEWELHEITGPPILGGGPELPSGPVIDVGFNPPPPDSIDNGESLCATFVEAQVWASDAYVASYPSMEVLYYVPQYNSKFVATYPTPEKALESVPNWRSSEVYKYENATKTYMNTSPYVYRDTVYVTLRVWHVCDQ